MLIVKLYMTLLGPILAGVVNSIFCKLNIFKSLKKPLDFNKKIKGKRIFGDNKTWKGLLGYIFFNIIFMVLVGIIYKACNIENLNFFYINHKNTLVFNILVGALLGLFYALFELPNSFMKRRLDIKPGKTIKGPKKYFFIFLDQADSVFGVALVVWMFYPIGIKVYLLYILVGAVTHLLINMLLYALHLRKNLV